MALDLLHAVKTGQFPYPGAMRDQPSMVVRWFRTVQMMTLAAERARAGLFGAAIGGDVRPKKPKKIFFGKESRELK